MKLPRHAVPSCPTALSAREQLGDLVTPGRYALRLITPACRTAFAAPYDAMVDSRRTHTHTHPPSQLFAPYDAMVDSRRTHTHTHPPSQLFAPYDAMVDSRRTHTHTHPPSQLFAPYDAMVDSRRALATTGMADTPAPLPPCCPWPPCPAAPGPPSLSMRARCGLSISERRLGSTCRRVIMALDRSSYKSCIGLLLRCGVWAQNAQSRQVRYADTVASTARYTAQLHHNRIPLKYGTGTGTV